MPPDSSESARAPPSNDRRDPAPLGRLTVDAVRSLIEAKVQEEMAKAQEAAIRALEEKAKMILALQEEVRKAREEIGRTRSNQERLEEEIRSLKSSQGPAPGSNDENRELSKTEDPASDEVGKGGDDEMDNEHGEGGEQAIQALQEEVDLPRSSNRDGQALEEGGIEEEVDLVKQGNPEEEVQRWKSHQQALEMGTSTSDDENREFPNINPSSNEVDNERDEGEKQEIRPDDRSPDDVPQALQEEAEPPGPKQDEKSNRDGQAPEEEGIQERFDLVKQDSPEEEVRCGKSNQDDPNMKSNQDERDDRQASGMGEQEVSQEQEQGGAMSSMKVITNTSIDESTVLNFVDGVEGIIAALGERHAGLKQKLHSAYGRSLIALFDDDVADIISALNKEEYLPHIQKIYPQASTNTFEGLFQRGNSPLTHPTHGTGDKDGNKPALLQIILWASFLGADAHRVLKDFLTRALKTTIQQTGSSPTLIQIWSWIGLLSDSVSYAVIKQLRRFSGYELQAARTMMVIKPVGLPFVVIETVKFFTGVGFTESVLGVEMATFVEDFHRQNTSRTVMHYYSYKKEKTQEKTKQKMQRKRRMKGIPAAETKSSQLLKRRGAAAAEGLHKNNRVKRVKFSDRHQLFTIENTKCRK